MSPKRERKVADKLKISEGSIDLYEDGEFKLMFSKKKGKAVEPNQTSKITTKVSYVDGKMVVEPLLPFRKVTAELYGDDEWRYYATGRKVLE